MTSIYKARRATILLCSVAVAVLATSAFARPDHHRHREARAPQVTSQSFTGADRDVRYPANMSQAVVPGRWREVKASVAGMPADLRPTRGRGLSRNRIQPMAPHQRLPRPVGLVPIYLRASATSELLVGPRIPVIPSGYIWKRKYTFKESTYTYIFAEYCYLLH